MGIVIGICDGFLLLFALGFLKIKYQEYWLDSDCVGNLLGVALGIIIGMSVVKHDGDKVGCCIGRILGTPCSRTVFFMSLPFALAQCA